MRILILILLIVLFQSACKQQETHLFRLIESDESGIYFTNNLAESDTFNALTFEYIYNGAGVGIADFNNDSLPDIFFTGNMTSSQLYLNKSNLSFEEVTKASGVTTSVWCTGVSVVDINQDGWMDIYISTIHSDMDKHTSNIFFINTGIDEKGIPQFENRAGQLGVADSSYSTQAVFFDYDLDGDLDMYLLTNSLESTTRNTPRGQHTDGTGKSVDRLYRHDKLPDGNIHFTDVSNEAGILTEGWGLGIIINDFNDDGWPDVYCANDFLSSDHLYINQQDGTFKDDIGQFMSHQEFNGMGVDMADLNNDGFNDLVAIDMMPEDNLRQKTMFSGISYDRFMKSIQMKYQPQYIRNVLQRNNGNGTFSDVGYMSSIYATDWSWAALLADFDNDGLRDIFISNGYPKDITDLDFVTYNKNVTQFGTDELKRQNAAKAISELGGVYKPNFLFHNKGDLQFDNVAEAWGLSMPTYSNGAAYADLDFDGDLDLVVNNLNSVSQVYENTTNTKEAANKNYIQLRFNGPIGNPQGIGAKVWLYADSQLQYAEQQLQRGYLSSVDPVMHFGVGKTVQIDSLVIRWPDHRVQVLRNAAVNTIITAVYDDANERTNSIRENSTLLINDEFPPMLVMPEQEYVDYKNSQPTLPHKFSQQGPKLAIGDVNNDGLQDFIVGGSAHTSAKIFYQQADGRFHVDSLMVKASEDIGLLLFDADNDNDLDLYCVSGSSEFGMKWEHYQDRLYKNDGTGKFTLDQTALPEIKSSGSCVVAADIDKDGDLDLFIGGRIVPTSYPVSPRSYLLRNDGTGKFEDVTVQVSEGLDSVGMVTSALFSDFDNDGWSDLIVAGEWMPITMFKNDQGQFRKTTTLKTGWWSSLAEGDFDNDGDIDYIAGNLGLNSILQASEQEPVSLYAKDFDGNGSMDPLISRYIEGREHPVHYRETMTEQVVSLRRILQTYADYGRMEMEEILNFLGRDGMIVKRADYFASCYLQNNGDGNFTIQTLPRSIQVSPINSIAVSDINNDGHLDFLAVGNSFSEEPVSGYYDAGIGVCALGNGDGTFTILSPVESGFCVRSDAKAIKEIEAGNKRRWIITSNQAPMVWFSLPEKSKVVQ